MPTAERIQDDLRYVRDAVQMSQRRPTPAPVYALWALIGGVGFPLNDFVPQHAGLYWLIAAPAGLGISLVIARRRATSAGQRRLGARRHALHWGGLLLAALLALPLALGGRLDGTTLGEVILLLVALSYFHAGVHLDPALMAVSGLIALGYLALFALPAWGWTVVGVTFAAGLLACAWIARRPGGEEAA